MIVLDFFATLAATLIGVYFAYRWGVNHERKKKQEDEEESRRRILTAVRKELETNLAILRDFDKAGALRGTEMFLWTDAYQTGVSAGDRTLLDPQLQTKLGFVYNCFRQLRTYGEKLIDLRGINDSEEAEKFFLILMDQATEATLKFIPLAIQAIDVELMKKKTAEFVDLVNNYPRMDIDDLRLALSSKLDMFTNIWIFGMTVVIAIVAVAFQLSNEGFSLVTKIGLVSVALVLYLILISKRQDPEKRLENFVNETDYFDAKEIILKRTAEKEKGQ
jgi:hypothetical protein